MTRLNKVIKEVLSNKKKKDCNCGCGGCAKKSPTLTENKVKEFITEGLQYHITNNISLFESVYRIGSEKHLDLINEARALWVRGLIDVSEDDQALLETHLGHFGLYEGVEVPLDLPMVNEEKDRADEIVRDLFGLDFEFDYTYKPEGNKIVIGAEGYNPDGTLFDMKDVHKEKIIRTFRDKIPNAVVKPNMGGGITVFLKESLNEEAKMPSQEEVDKFFSITQNEMHYLNSKPVMGQKGDRVRSEIEPWDEYDLSNWNALVRKAKAQGKLNEEVDEEGFSDKIIKSVIKPEEVSRLSKVLNSNNIPFKTEKLGKVTMFKFKSYDDVDKVEALISRNRIDIDEDMNDPVLVKARAAKIAAEKEKVKQAALDKKYGSSFMGKLDAEIDLKQELQDLKDEREQLMIDMEQEAEPEGGEIANRYGSRLNDIDAKMVKIKSDLDDLRMYESLDEAKKKKKKKKEKKDPPLNKPKRGGSKAYYVYVRDPKTKKIKKVSFGSGGLRAKIKNKEARNSFAARHNCKNKKDRTMAGYWSCNLPRYADQLGLGSKMNTFW